MKFYPAAFLALCPYAIQARTFVGPFPEGVPGSGYGCSNTCNGGDVNYVVKASIESYKVPGTVDTQWSNGEDELTMYTRTWTGVADESSPFCQGGDDGSTGPLGPCLTVRPGQTMNIKVINDMNNGMAKLNQVPTSAEQYWQMDIGFYGELPPSPEDMKANPENLPGVDVTYDDTNLHLHGMNVVPHLFYPMGTGNSSAEWITITPGAADPEHQCFCYVFDVPEDHPQGTYFWHIHRHGATAMQAWQGMVGFMEVGDADSEGSPWYELEAQGITRHLPLALWDWRFGENATSVVIAKDGKEESTVDVYIEDSFNSPTPQILSLTNNEFQPTVKTSVNQTLHFQLLCAQTAYSSALFVYDENNETVPFWVFASDGVSYDAPYQKDTIVVGPGQREDLLMQFTKAGTYRLQQTILRGYAIDNNYIIGLQTATFIEVKDISAGVPITTPVNISGLVFTRGIQDDIDNSEVVKQSEVTFAVGFMRDSAPAPQFTVDNKLFDYERIDKQATAGTAQQWTITSLDADFHPFHIHVNPFQIISVTTGNLPGVLDNGVELKDAVLSSQLVPAKMWRDTVFVPPFGIVSVVQRFGEEVAFEGKTVFHCHFLDHEDLGMISAFMIMDPSEAKEGEDEEDAHRTRGLLRGGAGNSHDE